MKTIKSSILLAGLFLLISCVSDNPIKDEPQIRVTGLTINKSSTSIVEGGSETLIVTISPDKAANKNVLWSSQDVSVATVSEGKITAVKAGTSIITATTVDGGIKAICTVTVTTQAISVTGLTLDKTEVSINVGKTEVLVPTITPTNATNHEITWVSSNVSVATIKDGVVTAVSAGTATITATTVDGGKSATCTVTVTAPVIDVDGLELNKLAVSLKVGSTETLVATVTPSNATNKEVKWTSSNALVATVKNGVVTAISPGTATISVTAAEGVLKQTCEVSVAAVVPDKLSNFTISTSPFTVVEATKYAPPLKKFLVYLAEHQKVEYNWSCNDSRVVGIVISTKASHKPSNGRPCTDDPTFTVYYGANGNQTFPKWNEGVARYASYYIWTFDSKFNYSSDYYFVEKLIPGIRRWSEWRDSPY